MGNRKLATILRCTGLALFVLGAFVLLPAAAQAGQPCSPTMHGVSIFKSCTSPKNRCVADSDCSDANQCNGLEQCATEDAPGSNVVECIITLTNPEAHCDNLTLLDAADAVINAIGPGASSTTIVITGTSTGVVSGTCTAGTDLGGATTCTIAPGGSVDFLANYYTIQPADPATLIDQATVSVQDTCSAGAAGCSTTANQAQFTASTETVSGCGPGTPLTCDDGLFCTDDACDPATGCTTTPHDCADTDNCTDDICNEDTDTCDHPPADPLPLECTPSEEICRTPGFWGTHGGVEKSRSTNITQAILDNFGGTLFICGATISNTTVGSPNSALEAICVSPKGDSRLQLARQLTAAALNCGITNSTDTAEECTGSGEDGAAPCTGVSIEGVFNACNAACPTGTTAVVDGNTISCIGAIDCFNNGGIFDPATGDCASAEGTSCHDRQLVNGCFDFQPPGPAGSPRACNDARKNNVVVVPPLP